MYASMADELEKIAIIEEATRFLLRDVPGTPRMVMRKRNLLERAATGRRAHNWVERNVAGRIRKAADPLVRKLPKEMKNPLHLPKGELDQYLALGKMTRGKKVPIKETARKVVDLIAEDPVSSITAKGLMVAAPATAALPTDPMLRGAKKLLRKGIDKIDPVSESVQRQLPKKLTRVGWSTA